jgi:hypothetical protein
LRANRERPEKILVAMHKLADGETRFLKYEDIVVRAFEMFPGEFALRGYPQYPDSSDIHKPLYGVLKRQGLIRSANKTFALTALGVERAKRLMLSAGKAIEEPRSADRLTRAEDAEVDRALKSAAFGLFIDDKRDRILDTDFYAFFGCTVRTPKNDFIGRLNATRNAIKHAKKLGKPDSKTAKALSELIAYLNERFEADIDGKVGSHAH